jgi:hypothetical protein
MYPPMVARPVATDHFSVYVGYHNKPARTHRNMANNRSYRLPRKVHGRSGKDGLPRRLLTQRELPMKCVQIIQKRPFLANHPTSRYSDRKKADLQRTKTSRVVAEQPLTSGEPERRRRGALVERREDWAKGYR